MGKAVKLTLLALINNIYIEGRKKKLKKKKPRDLTQ